MQMASPALDALCQKLQYVLRSVWVVKLVALVFVVVYFFYLFCLPREPRLRRTKWAGHAAGNVYVAETREEPEWWVTSISEYAAARGSTGSKLLGSAMAVCGALQVIEGALLGQLCVATPLAKALLWAGGIGAIVLGQCEASDEYDDSPEMLKLKKAYAVVHAIGAIVFVVCTTAGVLITVATDFLNWVGGGLAIAGCFFFGLAVLAQNLTGNYAGTPQTCMIPQRPEDRVGGPGETKRFGLCHRWLNSMSHRIWLSRLVLSSELLGVSFTIFSVTYISIWQSVSGRFCDSPTYLTSCLGF